MDAATLYIVLTLSAGSQTISTQGFASMQACEAAVEILKNAERASYRCEGHNPFAFIDHKRRGRSRHLVTLSSRQACTAYQWIAYLRDRSPRRLGDCFEDPPAYDRGWRE
jgi:hypothetical protein